MRVITTPLTTLLKMGNAPKMTISLNVNSSRTYLEKRTWNMSSSAENIKFCTHQGPASPTLPNGGKEGRWAFMSLLVVIPVADESCCVCD